MARRLKQLAEEINRRFPRMIARIEKGYYNTDRKIPGTRLIRKGKGLTGNRLIVRWRRLSTLDPMSLVLDHNAAEWYRRNEDVERWLRDEAPNLVEPKKTKGVP
jgi:hypothetical protein